MLATINTDISLCPKTKVAGYAFWITCDLFRYKTAGHLKNKIRKSFVAESQCIVNAVNKLTILERKYKTNFNHIIINTDSKGAIRLFNNNIPKGYNYIRKPFFKIKKEFGYRYDFRHVKAHSKVTNSRRYVNDWCDKAAKNQMRCLRNKIIKEKS